MLRLSLDPTVKSRRCESLFRLVCPCPFGTLVSVVWRSARQGPRHAWIQRIHRLIWHHVFQLSFLSWLPRCSADLAIIKFNWLGIWTRVFPEKKERGWSCKGWQRRLFITSYIIFLVLLSSCSDYQQASHSVLVWTRVATIYEFPWRPHGAILNFNDLAFGL